VTVLPKVRAVPLDRYGYESVAARIARRTQESLFCLRDSAVNKNNHYLHRFDDFFCVKLFLRARKCVSGMMRDSFDAI
jgi:hypothetical protein